MTDPTVDSKQLDPHAEFFHLWRFFAFSSSLTVECVVA